MQNFLEYIDNLHCSMTFKFRKMSCFLFFKVKASMALSVKSNSLFYQAQRCCLQGPMGYTLHFRTQSPRDLNVSLFKAITRLFCLMLRDVTAGLVVSLHYALVEKMRFSCSVLRLGSCKMGKAEVGKAAVPHLTPVPALSTVHRSVLGQQHPFDW